MSKMLRKYETPCCYFCDTGTEREIPDINLPKIREKLFPTEKSEIQFRENFFPRNAQNRRSETLNCRENVSATHSAKCSRMVSVHGSKNVECLNSLI